MKGASEVILKSCSAYLNQTKNRVDLNDSMMRNIKESINKYENKQLLNSKLSSSNKRYLQGGIPLAQIEYLEKLKKTKKYLLRKEVKQ
jgi:magnesium-transporting ATPase (P-type)